MAAAGIHIGKSTYAEYESGGKVPSKNHLPMLEAFWGPVSEPETSDQSLTAALAAQTTALTALVDELRLWRQEDRERLGQVESMLDGLVAESLGAPGRQAAAEPLAPARTAG